MGYAGQVAYIHGGLGFEERDAQVERFRAPHDGEGKGARFFIGTDAAAEGINLQFCGILFNYDVPWNPARLEQRMGRIHRYGQKRDRVAIVNLVAGKTREGRVIKTLLDQALHAFGPIQNAHTLALFKGGQELNDTQTIEAAGITPHEVLLLRPSTVKGG